MKTLKESLLSDIDTNLAQGDMEIEKRKILQFVNDTYDTTGLTISEHPNTEGKYEVSAKKASIKRELKKTITRLTNGQFTWKNVSDTFDCGYCINLESLEGAPEIIGIAFYCNECKKLKSFDGFPKKIGYKNKSRATISLVGLNKKLSTFARERLKEICDFPDDYAVWTAA